MSAPAYTLESAGLTFCASCAYGPTAISVIIALGQVPEDMDDAIAMIVLSQIENGMEISAPIALNAPGRCDNCGKDFAPFPGEAA